MPSCQGFTVPVVGAKRAALTAPESMGSLSRASSPDRSRSPGTPFFWPWSSFFRKTASPWGP